MARRNRVDPFGDLHAVGTRGLITGNRGCLVDDRGEVRRHHIGNAWILCELSYRGWHHPVAAPGTWTPLFFLDDAVGLAAGHRPCGLCRREDYRSYLRAVGTGAGDAMLRAPTLDQRLASERFRPGRGLSRGADRITWPSLLDSVPSGAVIVDDDRLPWLVGTDGLRPFAFEGWGAPETRPRGVAVEVLTPPTSVLALAHGFPPRLHPSAAG